MGDDQLTTMPLNGVRVMDFSTLLPGPFCTQMLADLGATVIKIEPLQGEGGRHVAEGSAWPNANRNKQSVAVNLKVPRGAEICRRLSAVCDVVLEGFRPGVADRLGLGAEAFAAINPELIYCSLSGFGQSGPMHREAGHDINYLASSGALAFSGHWGERPRRSGIPIADLGSASLAALSIVAALYQRRNGDAWPRRIDIGLRDVALSFASVRSGQDLVGSHADDQAHLGPTNDLFVCSDDRQIALGVVEDAFWMKTVDALREVAPDLAEADYSDERARRYNGDRLKQRLAEIFSSRSSDHWVKLFSRFDVPVQHVLSFAEAIQHPQTTQRGLVVEHDGQRFASFPVLFDGAPPPIRSVPPVLGADTKEVLVDLLGYDDSEVTDLAESGVVVTASAASLPR